MAATRGLQNHATMAGNENVPRVVDVRRTDIVDDIMKSKLLIASFIATSARHARAGAKMVEC